MSDYDSDFENDDNINTSSNENGKLNIVFYHSFCENNVKWKKFRKYGRNILCILCLLKIRKEING